MGKEKGPFTSFFMALEVGLQLKLVKPQSTCSEVSSQSPPPVQRNKAAVTNQVESSLIMRVFLTAGYVQLTLHFMTTDQPAFNRRNHRNSSRSVNSVGLNLGCLDKIFQRFEGGGRCFFSK